MKPISTSVAVILLALLSGEAVATPACMTKAEARAAYPRAHLYWSGSNRCWSDRAGRSSARRYRPAVDDSEPVKKPPPPFPLPSDTPTLTEAPKPPPKEPEYPDARLQRLAEQRLSDKRAADALANARAMARVMSQFDDELPSAVMRPMRDFTVPPPEPPGLDPMMRWSLALSGFVAVSVAAALLSRHYWPRIVGS
jgi:hypothetical protein